MQRRFMHKLAGLLAAGLLATGAARAQAPVFDYAFAFGSTVPYTSGTVQGKDAAADAAGNVYVTGTFIGTATFGATTLTSTGFSNDIFVAKLTPGGQWAWAVQAGGSQYDQPQGIAVDNAGNVYLAGEAMPQCSFGSLLLPGAGGQDAFVAKLSAAGQWQWVSSGGGGSSDYGYDVAVDAAGNAYVCGSLQSQTASFGTVSLTASGNNVIGLFVAKLDATGTWQWARSTGRTVPTVTDRANRVAADAAGNVYIAGDFFSATLTLGSTTLTNAGPGAITSDAFVAKLSTTGQWQWAVQAGGPAQEYVYGFDLDAAGNVYLGGELQSPAVAFGGTTLGTNTTSNMAAYVAKLNPAGQWQWAAQSGRAGTGSASTYGRALAVAPDGSSYVGGFFNGRPSFGSTAPTSAGTSDAYVAKLTPAGQWQWAVSAGGSSHELVQGIALDAAGNAVLTGAFGSPSIAFGSLTLTNPTNPVNNLGFVARLASVVTTTPTPAQRVTVAVWPNPARTTATVTLPPQLPATELLVLNGLGQAVRRQRVASGAARAVVDVAGLPRGLYAVRCGLLTGKLLVE